VNTLSVVVIAVAIQLLSFGVLFSLTIVSRRSAMGFVLLRDAPHFLLGTVNRSDSKKLQPLRLGAAK
jgi:hypothetical protein